MKTTKRVFNENEYTKAQEFAKTVKGLLEKRVIDGQIFNPECRKWVVFYVER